MPSKAHAASRPAASGARSRLEPPPSPSIAPAACPDTSGCRRVEKAQPLDEASTSPCASPPPPPQGRERAWQRHRKPAKGARAHRGVSEPSVVPARVDQGVARWRGRMCGCWRRLTYYLRIEKSTASSQSHRYHVHHLPQSARGRSIMPDNRREHRGHQHGRARGRRPASTSQQREYCAGSQQCRNVNDTRCAPRQGC